MIAFSCDFDAPTTYARHTSEQRVASLHEVSPKQGAIRAQPCERRAVALAICLPDRDAGIERGVAFAFETQVATGTESAAPRGRAFIVSD